MLHLAGDTAVDLWGEMGPGGVVGEQSLQRHPKPPAGRDSPRPLPDWQCFPT